MADIEVEEQRAITISEIKEKLEEHKKKVKELNFRATKVEAYAEDFTQTALKQTEELQKKLSAALPKLREKHIVKIIDVMPDDINSVKTIFTGEAVNLKQEELKQIVDIVNE